MTLKARNRLFILFFIISTVYCVANVMLFAHALYNNSIIFPTPAKFIRFTNILSSLNLFKYDFYAVFAGILFFQLYVILTSIYSRLHFEKTQALEIIYFYGFLAGCLLEGARLLVITGNLWRTASGSFIVLQRVLIAGRVIAPLSLLFAALFSETSQRENVERNIVIVVIIAIITGRLYPIETTRITSTFATLWGFQQLFTILCIFVALSTSAAMLYTGFTNNLPEMRHETIGYLIMTAGYFQLWVTDNYFCLILSMVLLTSGTIYYLHSLHSIYSWK